MQTEKKRNLETVKVRQKVRQMWKSNRNKHFLIKCVKINTD